MHNQCEGKQPVTNMNLFDRIDNILHEQSIDNHYCILNISELDGFFHALACSPELVRPSTWLHGIWGGAEHTPQWPDMRSAQAFMNEVITHYNDVMSILNTGECEPVFLQTEENNTVRVIAEDWCLGFQRGMKYLGDSADKLADHLDLIAPIMLFSSDELTAKLNQLSQAETEKYQNMIPLCVLEIRKLLGVSGTARITPEKTMTEAYVNIQKKTGRNDLCACGSGKKHKQCCGVN